jgi:hypothetical protein
LHSDLEDRLSTIDRAFAAVVDPSGTKDEPVGTVRAPIQSKLQALSVE